MKRPLRLKKTLDLLKDYQEIASVCESLEKTLGKLPEGLDIKTQAETVQELTTQQVKKLELLLEFIRRFSPMVAKELRLKLKKVVKANQEYRKRAVENQNLPQSVRREFITEGLGFKLIDQWITLTFSSVGETLKLRDYPCCFIRTSI